MDTSARSPDPPWSDISKEQWNLLWSGELTVKKHGETLWAAGHKSFDLYRSLSATEVPRLMLLGEDVVTTRPPPPPSDYPPDSSMSTHRSLV